MPQERLPIREPAVAGYFYESEEEDLRRQIGEFVRRDASKLRALGLVSPHAGYQYSGPVAGAVFSSVEIPERVVVLAPNHTGYGPPFSLWKGSWRTPLGDVPCDVGLAEGILGKSRALKADELAHVREHSAEVQIPFLQFFRPDISLVGIVIRSMELKGLEEFGRDLAGAISETGGRVLVVASSDMTHYEPQESAQQKDKEAIAKVVALDPDGLWDTVHEHAISMCGVAPTAAMLTCCKALGAKEGKLIQYRTSGDASGDYSQVVGYAGIVVI